MGPADIERTLSRTSLQGLLAKWQIRQTSQGCGGGQPRLYAAGGGKPGQSPQRRRCRQGLEKEFGGWVRVGETFQLGEVGETLMLGRVRRQCCRHWLRSGANLGLSLSSGTSHHGNLNLSFSRMRVIVIEISSKTVKMTYTNVCPVLSRRPPWRCSIIICSEHREGRSQRWRAVRAASQGLVSCLKDRGAGSTQCILGQEEYGSTGARAGEAVVGLNAALPSPAAWEPGACWTLCLLKRHDSSLD